VYFHNIIGKGKIVALRQHTVEIRMFKSTVKREIFYKNLEFADAIVRFCRIVSWQNLNSENFCNYVSNKKDLYPNLHNHINKVEKLNANKKD